MVASNSVEAAAEDFFKHAGLSRGKYLTLHVRRGDAMVACDTSVPKVVEYVTCSVEAGGWSGRQDQPLVIFTDERDPQYKNALLNGITNAFGGRRRVLFGDPVIEDIAKSKDAPFLFETTLLVRHRAEGELFM